jgi:hypothetical protein
LAVKSGQAAGFDGVYPEFIKKIGQRTKEWIVVLFNDILTSGKIPKLFKRAKVITIHKTGKDGSDPSHFWPISLLRIQPLIDAVVPMSQAGFCKNRSWSGQVLALTSHIVAGFQRKLKTGVVFIDLTVAYDTVWRDGLMLKFMLVVPYAKLSSLMQNMLSNRFIQVFLDDIAVYGVESIMDYLKGVFWRGCCSACT